MGGVIETGVQWVPSGNLERRAVVVAAGRQQLGWSWQQTSSNTASELLPTPPPNLAGEPQESPRNPYK